jgi:hypothetical protein
MVRRKVRSKNLSHLNSLGFEVALSLPLRSGLSGFRPKEDIVARLGALEVLYTWVSRPGVSLEPNTLAMFRDWLTPDEQEILNLRRTEATDQFENTIGWKLENMWPLAWVLGFEHTPEVNGDEITSRTRDLILNHFMPAFATKFELRSRDEPTELEDLFYCAHNAARSAQLGGDTVPEDFDPVFHGGVIHERRHALTWCLSKNDSWEETDLST